MTDCAPCLADNGVLDWSCVACRTRYVLSLKSNAVRHAWISSWKSKGESVMANAVEVAVRAKLEAKRL